ncbi:MAG: lipase family protein [Rhizomicrobium sp.]
MMPAPAQLSDAAIAQICFRLYADTPSADPYWDHLWPQDGGFAAHKRVGDVDIVVWRGSVTAKDWLLNFDTVPAFDGALGLVHAGFVRGVWPLQDAITMALGAHVIVTGHSRGAAQATLFAGHLAAIGRAPVRLVTFGTPRPGYQQLADVLAAGKVAIASYKNLNDPVTDVPFAVDLIGTRCDLPYVHVAPFIQLAVQPDGGDVWGPVAPHHWQLYTRGLGNTPPPVPLPWWQKLRRVLAGLCGQRNPRQPNEGPLSEER